MPQPRNLQTRSASGPASDLLPVTPDDGTDLPETGRAIYVEAGGTLHVTTERGTERSFALGDGAILPLSVIRVHATGTTATGIHVFLA